MAATCFCCRFPCPYPDVLCAAGASALIGRNLRILWTLARWFTSFDGASLLLLAGFSVVTSEGVVSSLGGFGSASDNRRGKTVNGSTVMNYIRSNNIASQILRQRASQRTARVDIIHCTMTKSVHIHAYYIHLFDHTHIMGYVKGKPSHLLWYSILQETKVTHQGIRSISGKLN